MGLVTSPMVIGSRDARKQRRASFRIPADFMGCCQSLCLSDILPKHSSTLPTWTFSYLHAHTHIHTHARAQHLQCLSYLEHRTSHTALSHTTLSHTSLSHIVLSETTLSHTPFTDNSFTHSFAYNFDTLNSFHTPRFHTNLSNTSLPHTTFLTYRSSTTSFFFPPCPVRFNWFWLLEEVHLWGYPVLYLFEIMKSR